MLRKRSEAAPQVCRVQPDLPALERAFDYLVPDELADDVRVGTIVRVPLHGRRVRGWVIGDHVAPETDASRLRPLAKVVSAGPPADVVRLCQWTAWRYSGPVANVLRAASPPNVVATGPEPEPESAVFPAAGAPPGVGTARSRDRAVFEWAPATDRRVLVRSLLASEGSTIVVTPETAMVPVLRREIEREGRTVVVLRGDVPDAERTRQWDRARAGASVVVGGRLAVFAPVPDLRAIVVLDEGDEALKEERAPTWNAREVALERAAHADAHLVLVSPAPTLEAESAAGAPVRPPRGVERDGWPRLEVADRRDEPPGRGLFSDALSSSLHAALTRGATGVCVLNRRGRARLLECRACRHVAQCETCGAAVAEASEGFVCPRCGTTRPRVCLQCHGTAFTARRPGVTRVAEQLGALLPRARVAEVDASTEHVPQADVLVGTEAVLHRVRPGPRPVHVVAFLEFDQELLAARYRAAEQALWLLVRATRLVGGRGGEGRVLVQTRAPGHEVLEAVRAADPSIVADAERARRRALGFPPFGGLAEVAGAPAAVQAACDTLQALDDVRVLGPTTTGAAARALLKAHSAEALAAALATIDLSAARAKGRLRVEVDPLRV